VGELMTPTANERFIVQVSAWARARYTPKQLRRMSRAQVLRAYTEFCDPKGLLVLLRANARPATKVIR